MVLKIYYLDIINLTKMKKILIIAGIFLMFLTSCGNTNSQVNIINPDADFVYFYGATCPHCQELNDRVKEVDLFSKISVEKREVWFNKANQAKFYETAASLWLKESDLSVPFVYDKTTGKHAVGTDNVWDVFNSWITEIQSNTGTNTQTWAIISQ